jgi:hypothetical protein
MWIQTWRQRKVLTKKVAQESMSRAIGIPAADRRWRGRSRTAAQDRILQPSLLATNVLNQMGTIKSTIFSLHACHRNGTGGA